VDTKTSSRRVASRKLRCVLFLGVIGLVSSLLSVGHASAAVCAPHFSGSWIGTYSTTDFLGGGAVRGPVQFSGNTMTGTLYLGPDDVGGYPILATVNCNDVTLGTVAGVTFEGTFAADGKHMTGTWQGLGIAGIFSTALATDAVSTDGTTLTTDPAATGATADDPVQATITSPTSGNLIIEHASVASATLAGYQLLDQIIHIEAPPATSVAPLSFGFELDSSLLHGAVAADVAVFRNNTLVPNCTGAPGVAVPDPCISSRVDLGNGNVGITLLTSTASIWSFGVAPVAIQGPAFFAGSASINEGSGGKARSLQIPVTLNAPQTGTVSVRYTVNNGTATAGSDFTPRKSGTLTFKPDVKTGLTPTTKFVTVKVTPDQTAELSETLLLTLSAPSAGMNVGYATGIGTIIDDDAVPDSQLSVGDVRIFEGDAGTGVVKVPVTRSLDAGAASVTYTLVNVTTTAGADYTAKTGGKVSFAAGQSLKMVTIKVSAELLVEPDEVVQIVLSAPNGAILGRSTGQVTIVNDD
jgi:hypothetical protein